MDINYQLKHIEQQQENDVLQQQENARQLQLARTRLLYSRHYNSNALRIGGKLAPEIIVTLNYVYDEELKTIEKDDLANLNALINGDIITHQITEFQLNNI